MAVACRAHVITSGLCTIVWTCDTWSRCCQIRSVNSIKVYTSFYYKRKSNVVFYKSTVFVHESSPTSNLSHSTVISAAAGRTLSCRPLPYRDHAPYCHGNFPTPRHSTVTDTENDATFLSVDSNVSVIARDDADAAAADGAASCTDVTTVLHDKSDDRKPA